VGACLALLPLAILTASPDDGLQVGLLTETRMRLETSSPDPAKKGVDTFELDLRPRLLLKLGRRHRLRLVYNPRLVVPTAVDEVPEDATAPKTTLLHRGELRWTRTHRALTVFVTGRIEIGEKDFRVPAPAIDSSPGDEGEAEGSGAEPDAGDAASEAASGEGGEAQPAEESGEPAPEEEMGEELGAIDELPEVESFRFLSSTTTIGIEHAPHPRVRYSVAGVFSRSGGLGAEAEAFMPQRLTPGARGDLRIQLSRRDALRARARYDFNIFSADPTDLKVSIVQVDLGWERRLFRHTELRLGAGLGVGSSRAGEETERELFVTPVTTASVAQIVPLHGQQLKLALTSTLGPYTNPVSGKAAPRLTGGATLSWRWHRGLFLSLTEGITSTLDKDSFETQGLQNLFSAGFGYAWREFVRAEIGARNLYRLKPPKPDGTTAPPLEQWSIYCALTLDTGIIH
jgi:hypothetical protein